MRKSSLVLGCVLAVAFAGAGLASDTVRAKFHFARAQTTVDQFRSDLRVCQIAAKQMGWNGKWGNPTAHTGRGGVSATPLSVSATALQSCMGEKGYRLDSNGFSTGWMRTSA